MPLIDDRGRLLGKVNLIDAVIGLLVLVLIPLGYGAYLLFRVPVPTITSIEPQEIVEKSAATLTVVGQDLRPFLRARFGPFESAGFLIQSPTLAEIKVPPTLAPGTYDLTVYDEGRELVRKAEAVTVVPETAVTASASLPLIALQVTGAFIGISEADVDLVRAGTRIGGIAEVVQVGEPEPQVHPVRVARNEVVMVPLAGQVQVPAILRLRCHLTDETCRVGDAVVELDKTISIPAPGNGAQRSSESAPAEVRFLVKEVRTAP